MVALALAIGISAIGFTGYLEKLNTTFILYVALQVIFILMGFLMIVLFKRQYFGKFKFKAASEIILLIVNTAAGVIGFVILFNYTSKSDLGLYYSTAALWVSAPYFILNAFKILPDIPDAIYKVWYLDEDALEPDSDKINVERVYLITLEIYKNVNEKGYTHFELKAPHQMYFGDWFRLFILSYNERDSENPIQYKYLDNSGIGWVFFTKPTFLRSKRFIDPTLSFIQNGLNDKATIIASRVKINYQ